MAMAFLAPGAPIADTAFASDERGSMSLALKLGLIYSLPRLLTITRRSRSRTGTVQDRSGYGMQDSRCGKKISGGPRTEVRDQPDVVL